LIVGAGIGGLAAGIALRRAGWNVRIFERSATPRELGFALGLAPNAILALRELDLATQVMPHAMTASAVPGGTLLRIEIRRPDGRVIRRITARRDEFAGLDLPAVVLRPVLHSALLAALGHDAIATGSEAVGFGQDDGGVVLRLANGTTATGDILIGADGVASIIRTELHPDEPPPRPSGYFALRGATPAVHLLDGTQFIGYLGKGIEVGIVQAGAAMIYWYISLLADDVGGGVLEPGTVLRRVTAGFDEQFQAITAAATDMRLDELFRREPLGRWGSGRVTLLGDAAHPMLPHTGQGAAQALEDAVVLGRTLAVPGNFISGLRQYERIRAPRAHSVVRAGPRIARITTTRNPMVAGVRNSVIRLVPLGLVRAALSKSTRRDRPQGAPAGVS
jgi:2-polyprenyl-6-methoxyphenol hydroxylase-like FAD-dependent oxidoreductase